MQGDVKHSSAKEHCNFRFKFLISQGHLKSCRDVLRLDAREKSKLEAPYCHSEQEIRDFKLQGTSRNFKELRMSEGAPMCQVVVSYSIEWLDPELRFHKCHVDRAPPCEDCKLGNKDVFQKLNFKANRRRQGKTSWTSWASVVRRHGSFRVRWSCPCRWSCRPVQDRSNCQTTRNNTGQYKTIQHISIYYIVTHTHTPTPKIDLSHIFILHCIYCMHLFLYPFY